MNYAYPITETEARGLAMASIKAFVNDSPNPDEYFTYPDIAFSMAGFDPSRIFSMSGAENALTGQLKYDAAAGTYPVNKTKKMFPR